MPTTDAGKAIACRNATTHGLLARDVVLPSLGEDPEGYRRLEAEWMAQLPPRILLERHHVEKIAAASWRLRRLHRWQAQLFEDEGLTESERMDRLDKALRHETALHRQIDTAVKMLGKDAPQLFAQRAREHVQADLRMFERECRDNAEDEMIVAPADAPLDAHPEESGEEIRAEICENELPPLEAAIPEGNETADGEKAVGNGKAQKCENKPAPFHWDPRRVTEYLDPNHLQTADRERHRRSSRRRQQKRPCTPLTPS